MLSVHQSQRSTNRPRRTSVCCLLSRQATAPCRPGSCRGHYHHPRARFAQRHICAGRQHSPCQFRPHYPPAAALWQVGHHRWEPGRRRSLEGRSRHLRSLQRTRGLVGGQGRQCGGCGLQQPRHSRRDKGVSTLAGGR